MKSKIINYVVNRQNDDGGYAFCQGSLESNAQDTYYGLAILNALNAKFPNPERTEQFLKENRLNSIYSIYYVTKALLILGKDITPALKNQIRSLFDSRQYFGSTNFFSEVSSEFTTTYMAIEVATLLKMNVNSEVAEWLLRFRNKDGGFGTDGRSNINSTYYAVASLALLKKSLNGLHETVKFLRQCEKPYGGFTVIPINSTPYMEHTFYGIMSLDLLNEKSRYPFQTIEWVWRCQNKNGGFARSDLGISTFADTYNAIKILQKLGQF
ncbi:MAG: hypothetical protein N3D85_03915 [Candidatus Bathyarchaeota archaeon]|nr:hypothetical protein [Candidatus Bathyarchaeota archaeon]